MEKALIERIRSGLATIADVKNENPEEVLAVRCDTSVPQSRFFAEKAFGVVADKRQVLGVPHSTEAVDRMGDIIRLKGWELDNYKKNPVLMFGHKSGGGMFSEPSTLDMLPIAKALKVRKGQSASGLKALLIDEQFHDAEMNPQAELVWRLVADGALPGRSVGFLPLEVHRPENDEEREKLGLGSWGLEFRRQELLESSIVPVPANAEALQGKCYAIARETAKRAVEEGVATWGDVQRLAGILPITDVDQERIEREQRRSHVAFPQLVKDSDLSDDERRSILESNGLVIERDALVMQVNDLEEENEKLREQIADLARGIAALARTTEDRSERVDPEPEVEHRSNDEATESRFDILFRKIEERRKRREAEKSLADRLRARLASGLGHKEQVQ